MFVYLYVYFLAHVWIRKCKQSIHEGNGISLFKMHCFNGSLIYIGLSLAEIFDHLKNKILQTFILKGLNYMTTL